LLFSALLSYSTQGRIWKVKNPAVINPITHKPVAYKLMPMATPSLLASPESVVGKRAVFAAKNLWVSV
jgi:primary-amine oxidase